MIERLDISDLRRICVIEETTNICFLLYFHSLSNNYFMSGENKKGRNNISVLEIKKLG